MSQSKQLHSHNFVLSFTNIRHEILILILIILIMNFTHFTKSQKHSTLFFLELYYNSVHYIYYLCKLICPINRISHQILELQYFKIVIYILVISLLDYLNCTPHTVFPEESPEASSGVKMQQRGFYTLHNPGIIFSLC